MFGNRLLTILEISGFSIVPDDGQAPLVASTYACIVTICLNMSTLPYQHRHFHYKDYKNPLHFDVVDRYLRRMGVKTNPDEAPPSLESFYPPWVAGIDLPQSRCCGFFVSFTSKHK